MSVHFENFHPYLSFSDDAHIFINSQGEPVFGEILCGDNLDLWIFGSTVFSNFEGLSCKEDFDRSYVIYLGIIENGRNILKDAVLENRLKIRDHDDNFLTANSIGEMRSSEILFLVWDSSKIFSDVRTSSMYFFLFAALEEVDSALEFLIKGKGGILKYIFIAMNSLKLYHEILSGFHNLKTYKSENNSRAAKKRYEGDKKTNCKKTNRN